MKTRKLAAFPAAVAVAVALGSCAAASGPVPQDAPAGETELIVFAAASLTETLTQIKDSYEQDNPGTVIRYNFDSSGTLKTQIAEGADCDLFLSAGQRQMDQLDLAADASANPDRLDFVDSATRVDLLENKVVLCVPGDNPKGIESFGQLAVALEAGTVLMAMGNSDVPVGQYTQKIFDYYGLDEEALAAAGCISYGANVKEVTAQISESSVDCGTVYRTDAYSAGLTVADCATPELCGQIVYPAAVLKTSAHPEAAREFLDYLTGPEALAVFEAVGFSPAE